MKTQRYYADGPQKIGPISFAELRDAIQSGRLHGNSMVLQEGASTWTHASSIPGLLSSSSTQHVAIQSQHTLPATPAIVPSSGISVSGKVSRWFPGFSLLHGLKGRVLLGVVGFAILCVAIVCCGYLTGELGSHTTEPEPRAQALPPIDHVQPRASPQIPVPEQKAPSPKIPGKQKQDLSTPPTQAQVDPWQDIDLTNGERIDDYIRIKPNQFLETKKQYAGPVEIIVVVRTDKENIRLHAYQGSAVTFNCEVDPSELRVHEPNSATDKLESGSCMATKITPLVPHTWYKLRWVMSSEGIDVYVNNKHVFDEAVTCHFDRYSSIRVSSAAGSVVDVKTFVVKSSKSLIADGNVGEGRKEGNVGGPSKVVDNDKVIEREIKKLLNDPVYGELNRHMYRVLNGSKSPAKIEREIREADVLCLTTGTSPARMLELMKQAEMELRR